MCRSYRYWQVYQSLAFGNDKKESEVKHLIRDIVPWILKIQSHELVVRISSVEMQWLEVTAQREVEDKNFTFRSSFLVSLPLGLKCHFLRSCCWPSFISPSLKSKLSSPLILSHGLPWWLSGKESACQCRRRRFDPSVDKMPWRRKMAIYCSILAWEIPWTEEPGGLQSMDSKKSQTWLSV